MKSDHEAPIRIGVLVPFTNTILEPDMMRMCPDGATVHFQRMGGYDADAIPGSEQMAGLGASDIGRDLEMLLGARPRAVLYGCTSATLTHGPEFDAGLAADIKKRSGAIALTAAGCLVESLRAIGAANVGFTSPYVDGINNQAVAFLEQNGIRTVRRADVGRALDNYGQAGLSPDEIAELGLRADHPDAEAVVLSCTDMRSLDAVSRIEGTTGKTVVSSNQAMMFCLMRRLGIPTSERAPGRLFEYL